MVEAPVRLLRVHSGRRARRREGVVSAPRSIEGPEVRESVPALHLQGGCRAGGCDTVYAPQRPPLSPRKESSMPGQSEHAPRFRALHQGAGPFVIPNVWDGGSAAIMQALGFEALATSSAACAATLGKLDGEVTREEALTHAGLIVSVSACPVAGDLENGFGHSPETVAETIRFAAAAGLAGGSIEDASGDPAAPIYDFEHAVDRVAAAAAEAREVKDTGTFGYVDTLMRGDELAGYLKEQARARGEG